MSESTFLKHIQKDPFDMLRRRVYADWLQERGDIRGEYLHLECELAKLSLLAPEYQALKQQRDALRAKVDTTWRDQLGYGDIYRPMFTESELPGNRMEVWRRIERFLDLWNPAKDVARGMKPSEVEAAESDSNFNFPVALKEFLLLFGNLLDVWPGLLPWQASEVKEEEGFIKLRNSGLLIQCSDLACVDPPLYQRHRDGMQQLARRLTEYVVMKLLESCHKFASIRMKSGSQTNYLSITQQFDLPSDWEKMLSRLSPCNFFDSDQLTIYEGQDLILVHHRVFAFWVAARNQAALGQLPQSFLDDLRQYEPPANLDPAS